MTVYLGKAVDVYSGTGGGSGGDAVWGSITGTLSNQTDLQTALNGKQNTLTAGSGISIVGDVISATGGGSISYDNSTINENASNQLQAIGVVDKNSINEQKLGFWCGTESEWDAGAFVQFYDWTRQGEGFNVTERNSFNGQAIINTGTYYIASCHNHIRISSAGTSWNDVHLSYNVNGTEALAYDGNNTVVMVGDIGGAVSTDGGENWTDEPNWGGKIDITCATINDTPTFLAIDEQGGLYSSTNGTTITTVSTLDWDTIQPETAGGNPQVVSIHSYNGTVRILTKQGKVAVSTDGLATWSAEQIGTYTTDWPNLWVKLSCFEETNTWVALKADGTVYYNSGSGWVFGDDWYSIVNPDDNVTYKSIAYDSATNNEKMIALASDGSLKYTTNGTGWAAMTKLTQPEGQDWMAICSNGSGGFCAANISGTALWGVVTEHIYTRNESPMQGEQTYAAPDTSSGYEGWVYRVRTYDSANQQITLNNNNVYTYSSPVDGSGEIGEVYPNYISYLTDTHEIRKGYTTIANWQNTVTVDQNYSPWSQNAQSGFAVSQAIANKQNRLIAGSGISIVGDVISTTNSSVGDGRIIIHQNGNVVGSFTTNQANNDDIYLESSAPDGETITYNEYDQLETFGIKDQNNENQSLKLWKGYSGQWDGVSGFYGWRTGDYWRRVNSVANTRGMIHGGDGFYVLPEMNHIAWSDLGVAFNPININFVDDVASIGYSRARKYCAVGIDMDCAYSNDGKNWTYQQNMFQTPFGQGYWIEYQKMVYNPTCGYCVLVSDYSGINPTYLATSLDGSNWNTYQTPLSGKGILVSSGSDLIIIGNSSSYKANVADLSTWSTYQYSGQCQAACVGSGTIVAVDSSSVFTSVDGENWTVHNYGNGDLPADYLNLVDVIYDTYSSQFIAVSSSDLGMSVIRSANGASWSEFGLLNGLVGRNIVTDNEGNYILYGDYETAFKSHDNPSCYTLTETPSVGENVLWRPDEYAIEPLETINAIESGFTKAMKLSNGSVYLRDSSMDVTNSVGDLHPDYIGFVIEGGVKMGDGVIATYNVVDQTYDGTSANAQSGVAIAGVLGDIETLLSQI